AQLRQGNIARTIFAALLHGVEQPATGVRSNSCQHPLGLVGFARVLVVCAHLLENDAVCVLGRLAHAPLDVDVFVPLVLVVFCLFGNSKYAGAVRDRSKRIAAHLELAVVTLCALAVASVPKTHCATSFCWLLRLY